MAKCEFLQKKKRKALKPKAAGIRLSRRQLRSKVNQMWPVNQRCVYFYLVSARTNMQPAVSIPVAPSNKVSSLKEIIFFKSEKKNQYFFLEAQEKDQGCLNKKEEKRPANWWPAISQEMVCVLVCESVSRSNGSPRATLKGQGSVQEISVCRGTDNTHTHTQGRRGARQQQTPAEEAKHVLH